MPQEVNVSSIFFVAHGSRFSTPLCLFVPIFSLRTLSSFATTIVYSTYLDSLHSKDSFLDNEKHPELDKANSKTKDLS